MVAQRHITVLLTFLCTCVCYVERVGFSVAYTAAAGRAGVGEARKGEVLSSFYHGYASSQIVGGWVAQRFGGRRVLLCSFVLWSLTSAMTPTDAEAVGALVAARLMVGVAQGFIFPSVHTVLAQWVPAHERSRSVSLTTSGMYLGAALGMWLLPALLPLGQRSVFLAVAGLGAVWALAWYAWGGQEQQLQGKKEEAAEGGLVGGSGRRVMMIPWGRIVGSWPVWAIVVNNFTFHYALYVLMNWLPTYFTQGLKVGLEAMPLSKMLPYLLMFLFSNLGGMLADRLIGTRICSVANTRKLLNTLGFLTAAAALVCMPRLASPAGAVFCSSLALAFCALARAGFAVNHMDIAPRFAGILMGISNTAGTLAGSIGVAASGRILEASALGPADPSSWTMVFLTPALLCVASALFFCVFASGDKLFD